MLEGAEAEGVEMKRLSSEAIAPIKFRSPRDGFALGVLQILIERKFDWGMGGCSAREFAEKAYEFADGMMAERKRSRRRMAR